MGLKTKVTPPIPILTSTSEGKDVTPTVTPMRPTPLVGKWCDLPWSAEELVQHKTPQKAPSTMSARFLVSEDVSTISAMALEGAKKDTAASKSDAPSGVSKQELDALSFVLGHPIPSDQSYEVASPPPGGDRSSTAEPVASDDGSLEDLYLVTPMDTFGPEDFEATVAPTADSAAPSTEVPLAPTDNFSPSYAAETDHANTMLNAFPSNALQFVDFRRLQQQQPHPQQQQKVWSPNTFYHQPYPRPPVAAPSVVVGHPAASSVYLPNLTPVGPLATAACSTRPQGIVVLISRFPPPPPPGHSHMQAMLRTGSTFEAYYTIVMRWYAKVSRSVPRAHPHIPPCPPAEAYMTNFDGWVSAIEQWWAQHFTRRPRLGKNRRVA